MLAHRLLAEGSLGAEVRHPDRLLEAAARGDDFTEHRGDPLRRELGDEIGQHVDEAGAVAIRFEERGKRDLGPERRLAGSAFRPDGRRGRVGGRGKNRRGETEKNGGQSHNELI